MGRDLAKRDDRSEGRADCNKSKELPPSHTATRGARVSNSVQTADVYSFASPGTMTRITFWLSELLANSPVANAVVVRRAP